MNELHDLELVLRARLPIIVIETREEARVRTLFQRLISVDPRPLFQWTVTNGLTRVGRNSGPQAHARDPKEALAQIKTTTTPGIYLLVDFHPFMDDPVHVRLLKDIAVNHAHVAHYLVMVSHRFEIPEEISWFASRFRLRVPDRSELKHIVMGEARAYSRDRGRNVQTSEQHLERLIDGLMGLPVSDAQRLARGAIDDDGAIDDSDLPVVNRARYELLGRDGGLQFEFDTARFADVGGLARLKSWLASRAAAFAGDLPAHLDRPRGILLLGVQGCGKSLAAKAVAGAWGLALLRLDFGTLYNKFHGETERNLRDALRQAEAMAPCVLWIDEIEKGISIGDSDSGTSRRLLGTLLTWMAENDERVFIVATANDVQSLPPEIMRKGRMDEVFFVDLPDRETRHEILRIHASRRGLDPAGLELDRVAAASEGFSGAELEQVVVSALYAYHARNSEPDGRALLDEIARTRPLSVLMQEKIAQLRAWAHSRTVPAN